MTPPGLREQYLDAMGIPVWVLREADRAEPAAESAGGAPVGVVEEASTTWDALHEAVRTCTRCALHSGRTQTVFGVGSRTADLLVIGEAPGAEEDRRGEPFVGRAGQLLNAMLAAIHLAREEVYIANILKCRPPNNRDPNRDEAATCTPYLQRQIDLLQPRVILALGRIAAQWLLQTDAPIGRLRGRTFEYGDGATPLVVSYHPAYLLRSPLAKSKSWEDLKVVKRLLRTPE